MLLRICGAAFVVLALIAGTTAGQEKKDGAKDVVGKVKDVDAKKKSFSITIDDKTERTFLVGKDTKFTGPRGGDREDGLKDECMAKGYEVRVVPADDDKYAKEVKLAAWKAPAKGKKGG